VLDGGVEAGTGGTQLAVHLPGRGAQNEAADGIPADADVLIGSQDVDLGVRQHNPGLRRILNRELGFAVLPTDPNHPTSGPPFLPFYPQTPTNPHQDPLFCSSARRPKLPHIRIRKPPQWQF
jgi:hypothetical protein